MELYGVLDSEGNIYAVYWSPDDPGPDTIQLIENYTDAPSDWICRKTGKQYIRTDHLASLFRELTERISTESLSAICGNYSTLLCYLSGSLPVPQLIWDKVNSLKIR